SESRRLAADPRTRRRGARARDRHAGTTASPPRSSRRDGWCAGTARSRVCPRAPRSRDSWSSVERRAGLRRPRGSGSRAPQRTYVRGRDRLVPPWNTGMQSSLLSQRGSSRKLADMTTSTILVTGASGHLGRRVIELLLEAPGERTIIATTRKPEDLAPL